MFTLLPRQNLNPLVPVITLVLAAFLAGCSSGEPPVDGWEVAARGNYSAALSDDGKHLVIGSIMHGGSLWNLASKERLFNWNHAKEGFSNLSSVDISANGKFAVTAEGSTLVLWSVIDGAPSGFWSAPGEIVDLALSSDGHYALLGLANYSAVYFDIKNGGVVRTLFHKGRVTSVDLSADDRYALTGSEDNDAILWDIDTGEQLQVYHHERPVQLVALSPNGNLAFSFAKYDRALIWDVATGKTKFELPMTISEKQFGAEYSSAKFSTEDRGQILLGNNHRGVALWDYTKKLQKGSWHAENKEITQLASGAAILDLSFDGSAGGFFAITSDGMVQQFK
ncbi:MAG: hypothetical protein KUG72_11560 [Pseudomonadales bacterium]|nr:hypothetical protein [Pseudomonadales bacterium]